jgi:hypothetical protein
MRQPLTGPPWKKAAGVITPSFLKTAPVLHHDCTCLTVPVLQRYRRDAIRSAKYPALERPAGHLCLLTL